MDSNEQAKATDFMDFTASLASLEAEAKIALEAKLYQKQFDKGELVLETGTVCNRIYFVNSGLVKTFFFTGSREFIMRFFPEGNMFTVLDSFITRQPSTYSILALEPTTLNCLNHTDLEALCNRYHSMETFFRKLLSLAAVNMMDRIGTMLEEKAQVAYQNFLKQNGMLLQRISLADLAAYLGITQVSLSRIRSIR